MKILVSSSGNIIASAHEIAFGAWEERDIINDKIVHKWKLEDVDGKTTGYVVDENSNALFGETEPIGSTHEVTEIPEGAESGKYLYIDGEFIVNPDWEEPPKSDAERIAELEEEVVILQEENIASSEMEAELLYELSLMQLGIYE